MTRVFEFDIMGGANKEEQSFRDLVTRHHGRWWILAKQGPGGGNPSYLAAFTNDTDVYRFFEDYSGLPSPIKVVGGEPPTSIIPDFGVMELDADHVVRYAALSPTAKGGVYAANKVRVCKLLAREMNVEEALAILVNELLDT